MGPISLDITIDAPRERVFEMICDLALRPRWTDHFVSDFRLSRLEASGVGAAARFRVDAPGGIRYMETVIASARRPHAIVEQGRGGRWDHVAIIARWELSAGMAAPTELTLTFATEPRSMLGGLREIRARAWWTRRWRKALRRLAEQLETSTRAEPAVRIAGADRLPGAAH
ncbi:MAG TPA: SRPBCC family protein [Solirubrobacterales bacterium]|jgi:uncharacterized protein YndB with AHSA1/START domain|nr:SRPBCC family protein [Solirubrobacterales bacterium]